MKAVATVRRLTALSPRIVNPLSWGKYGVVRSFGTGVQEIEKQLEMFPEFKTGQEMMKMGNFQKAIPNYERVFDSLQAAVGKQSPLTAHLLFQLANCHRYSGHFHKAQSLISQFTPNLKQNMEAKFKLNQLLAVCYVLNRQFRDALTLSTSTLQECEHLNASDNPYSKYLSSLYGTLGISHLVNGDLDEAETFLQMSSRWAETPTEHLVAAANNGKEIKNRY
jgi:tetratricopeptide (TPR) repeat protein